MNGRRLVLVGKQMTQRQIGKRNPDNKKNAIDYL